MGHSVGLGQALFQKRGLVGLDCGLRGGDIGDGLLGREKSLAELSFRRKSGCIGCIKLWETLGDVTVSDGRGLRLLVT